MSTREALTPARRELADAMVAANGNGTWEAISGDTLRYRETQSTPEWISDRHWSDKTYTRCVFLTLTAGTPILGVARAPWVGREDSRLTLKRAHEVLANPAAEFHR